MTFFDFILQTDKSTIKDSIVFKYKNVGNFKYFNDSVSFYVEFQNSTIHSDEIALFSNNITPFHQQFHVSGIAQGSLGRLKVDDFKIETGKDTFIKGYGEFYGLPRLKETFINLKIKQSSIRPDEIQSITPEKAKIYLSEISRMRISGNFLGFPNDFVAKAKLTSPIGNIDTDINFKIDDYTKAWYSGFIELDHFDLRSLTNREEFKNISMRGSIDGNGLRLDNAKFDLNASIDSIKINEYNFQRLKTTGHFESAYFDGDFVIKDKNAHFDGTLSLDLRNDKNKIRINGLLDTLNLKSIGLLKQPISLGSNIDINMQGSKISELIGYINLYDNYVQ
jgi:hypothetical protein